MRQIHTLTKMFFENLIPLAFTGIAIFLYDISGSLKQVTVDLATVTTGVAFQNKTSEELKSEVKDLDARLRRVERAEARFHPSKARDTSEE